MMAELVSWIPTLATTVALTLWALHVWDQLHDSDE